MCLLHLWIYSSTQQIPLWRYPPEVPISVSLWGSMAAVGQHAGLGRGGLSLMLGDVAVGGMWKSKWKAESGGQVGRACAESVLYLLTLPGSAGSLGILRFSGVVQQQASAWVCDEKETYWEGFKLMSGTELRWVETQVKISTQVTMLRAERPAPGCQPPFADWEPMPFWGKAWHSRDCRRLGCHLHAVTGLKIEVHIKLIP